jgi:hypothetical protein
MSNVCDICGEGEVTLKCSPNFVMFREHSTTLPAYFLFCNCCEVAYANEDILYLNKLQYESFRVERELKETYERTA